MPGCVPISWQLLLDKIEIKLKAQNFQMQKKLILLAVSNCQRAIGVCWLWPDVRQRDDPTLLILIVELQVDSLKVCTEKQAFYLNISVPCPVCLPNVAQYIKGNKTLVLK